MYDDQGNYIGDASMGEFSGQDTSSTMTGDTSSTDYGFGGTSDIAMLGNLGGLMPVGYTPTMGAVPAIIRGGAYGGGRIAGRAVAGLWSLAQKFGPQLVAGVAGMTAEQLISVFLSAKPWKRRRRGRGISSRDMRTTRRVVRFVNRLQHDIGCVHRPAHARARARR